MTDSSENRVELVCRLHYERDGELFTTPFHKLFAKRNKTFCFLSEMLNLKRGFPLATWSVCVRLL